MILEISIVDAFRTLHRGQITARSADASGFTGMLILIMPVEHSEHRIDFLWPRPSTRYRDLIFARRSG